MHSLDALLEMAQANLLEARERGEQFNFSEKVRNRIDALKRAIGQVRVEAMEEAAAEAKPPVREASVLHLV